MSDPHPAGAAAPGPTDPRGEMSRGERARRAAWVLLCFGMVVIAAGHGVAPVALMLVFAPVPAASAAGALGVLLLAASLVAGKRAHYVGAAGGALASLAISLLLVLPETELVPLTLLTALPFMIVSTRWIGRLLDLTAITEPISAPALSEPDRGPDP
jgi:hypothetical protein